MRSNPTPAVERAERAVLRAAMRRAETEVNGIVCVECPLCRYATLPTEEEHNGACPVLLLQRARAQARKRKGAK